MEARLNQVFHQLFYLLKLSCYFWALNLMGLVGVTAMSVLIEHHLATNGDHRRLNFSALFSTFKGEYKVSLGLSWLYNVAFILIAYLIWFTSQLKGSLFFFLLMVQLCVAFLLLLSYFAVSQLKAHVEGPNGELIKLGLIQVFVTPVPNLMTGAFIVFCVVILRLYPALMVFFGPGLWLVMTTRRYQVDWKEASII